MDITNFVVTRRDEALLVGDYGTYRSRLSRRLLAARKRLGRTSPKGKKYVPKSPVTAGEIASNHEFVQLLLLTSERAWAHAMQMKSIHTSESKRIPGSARSHTISRLSKAVRTANELLTLLSDRAVTGASDTDRLEAHGYSATLRGALEFEKQDWNKCLKAYSTARVIYLALATSGKSDLFRDFVSNTIDPSIRYAAYQSRLPRTVGIPAVVKQYFPQEDPDLVSLIEKLDPAAFAEGSSASQGSSAAEDIPKSITWRSRSVDLQDAAIAQSLGTVAEAEATLSTLFASPESSAWDRKQKAAAYDDILTRSQEAADATRHAIEELVAEGVGQSDKRMQALQITRTAVSYGMISWRVGRNRVLVGDQDGAVLGDSAFRKTPSSKKEGKEATSKGEGNGRKLARLRERIVLYDSILQSLDSIGDLPGVAADESFMEELQGKRSYFQALKCLNIARSYTILSDSRKSLALLARASDLAERSFSFLNSLPGSDKGPPTLDIDPKTIASLHATLQAETARHQALVEIVNLTEELASSQSQKAMAYGPVIEDLGRFSNDVDLHKLVTYPPKVEPVPVKPLFLDVAWNYIDYPGRSKRVVENGERAVSEERAKEEAKEAKRGWFSFGR